MPHARIGSDDDPRPGVVCPPAEFDVLAMERDRRVEPSEGPEKIGSHEHARRWNHKDIADRVVLFLIGFAGLDERIDLAESVETEPDTLQHATVVPFGQFRTNDASI